jgi:hypothetical protein
MTCLSCKSATVIHSICLECASDIIGGCPICHNFGANSWKECQSSAKFEDTEMTAPDQRCEWVGTGANLLAHLGSCNRCVQFHIDFLQAGRDGDEGVSNRNGPTNHNEQELVYLGSNHAPVPTVSLNTRIAHLADRPLQGPNLAVERRRQFRKQIMDLLLRINSPDKEAMGPVYSLRQAPQDQDRKSNRCNLVYNPQSESATSQRCEGVDSTRFSDVNFWRGTEHLLQTSTLPANQDQNLKREELPGSPR